MGDYGGSNCVVLNKIHEVPLVEIHKNNPHEKTYPFADFSDKTPTHMSAAHAIAKNKYFQIEFSGYCTKILISPE